MSPTIAYDKMLGFNYSAEKDFVFDLDKFLESYPAYTFKCNAVRAIRRKLKPGIDYIEFYEGKRKKIFLTWAATKAVFFIGAAEKIGEAVEELLKKQCDRITELEQEVNRLNKLVGKQTINIPTVVQKVPPRLLLKKHGRNAFKEFMANEFSDLTAKDIAILRQSWDVLCKEAIANEKLRQSVVNVLSFLVDVPQFQESVKALLNDYVPQTNDPILEKKRYQSRMRQRRYRDRQKLKQLQN